MPSNKTGCFFIIFIGIIGLAIGFVCNHVAEQTEKLDTFSNFFIGAVIFGLIALCFYLYDSRK